MQSVDHFCEDLDGTKVLGRVGHGEDSTDGGADLGVLNVSLFMLILLWLLLLFVFMILFLSRLLFLCTLLEVLVYDTSS